MAKKTTTAKKEKPKPKALFSLGEVFTNKYLGTTITEILCPEGVRLGWIWVQECGKVIVSPNLGFYLWFDEGGVSWTMETGANWLAKKR